MAISIPDVKRLWGKAAGNRVRIQLVVSIACHVLDADKADGYVGEMAHIIARSGDGPRGRSSDSDDSYSNLILLCPTHHRLVDKAPEEFPAARLSQWKVDHEEKVFKALETLAFHDRVCDSVSSCAQFLPRIAYAGARMVPKAMSRKGTLTARPVCFGRFASCR